MRKIVLATNGDAAKFERCVDFLVRMVEKYSNTIMPASAEDIRERFPVLQCHQAA